jgi:hypothetical protein
MRVNGQGRSGTSIRLRDSTWSRKYALMIGLRQVSPSEERSFDRA